jgi:hypothetical protein
MPLAICLGGDRAFARIWARISHVDRQAPELILLPGAYNLESADQIGATVQGFSQLYSGDCLPARSAARRRSADLTRRTRRAQCKSLHQPAPSSAIDRAVGKAGAGRARLYFPYHAAVS